MLSVPASFAAYSLAEQETFHARMDAASWTVDSTLLVCRISQEIPFFGQAQFERRSGQPLQFRLHSLRPPHVDDGGVVELRVDAPRWKPEHPEEFIAAVDLRPGKTPVMLDERLASNFMGELYRGGTVRLSSDHWYRDVQDSTEVGLSPIAFRTAYKDYSSCLAELMPVQFEKLQRSKVHFGSDEHELPDEAISWLDLLASFLTKSPDFERVFIDGHTDDTNTTTYNVELSRQRAEAVREYLQRKGVADEQIVLRYHGERYPIKSNRNARGKAANRRVTIRLQMAPDADLPT